MAVSGMRAFPISALYLILLPFQSVSLAMAVNIVSRHINGGNFQATSVIRSSRRMARGSMNVHDCHTLMQCV